MTDEPDNTAVAIAESAGNTVSKKAASMGMDIGAAQDLYGRYHVEFVKEMEGLVRFCRENRVRAPLDNDNYLYALTYTDLMLRHTSHSFSMITGGGGDGFITSLRPSFEAMLRRLREVKSKARILILDAVTDTQTIREILASFGDVLQVIWATAGRARHCIVADGNMIRDEEWHERLEKTTDAEVIKAKVYFDNPSVAAAFQEHFDSLWNRLSRQEPVASRA